MGILQKIFRINPPKPVTEEELHELEMQAQKEELKARISKAKGSRPNILVRVLGKSNYNPFNISSSNKKEDDVFKW